MSNRDHSSVPCPTLGVHLVDHAGYNRGRRGGMRHGTPTGTAGHIDLFAVVIGFMAAFSRRNRGFRGKVPLTALENYLREHHSRCWAATDRDVRNILSDLDTKYGVDMTPWSKVMGKGVLSFVVYKPY